jgi:Cyclin, N-terminal domain
LISGKKRKETKEKNIRIRMDLSCNETMINDVENEYNIYVEYPSSSDEKSSATSAGDQNQQPTLQITSSSGIAKLYSNACADPTFLKDRCLKNLLTSQKRYSTPSCTYFNTVQKTLTPQMRKIVAEWVIEVSLSFHLTVPFVMFNRQSTEVET